jgi:hypothetical protein
VVFGSAFVVVVAAAVSLAFVVAADVSLAFVVDDDDFAAAFRFFR